jgi:hypothetical protein
VESSINRWVWDSFRGPERALAELRKSGVSWFRMPEAMDSVLRDPWTLARTLLGSAVSFLSRTRIKAVPGQTIYIEGSGNALFHTDQDTLDLGIPPYVQSWVCMEQAADGGNTVLLDTWPMLEEIETREPGLFCALFETPRRLSYPTGSFRLPAFSLQEGNLVCTHASRPAADDVAGRALHRWISKRPPLRLRLERGDVLLNHNHRVLHGRDAFSDVGRELIRTHYWLRSPMPAPERWLRYAAEVEARRKGLRESAAHAICDADARWRLGVVLEELSLISFSADRAQFANRAGINPGMARQWRQAVVKAALHALKDSPGGGRI